MALRAGHFAASSFRGTYWRLQGWPAEAQSDICLFRMAQIPPSLPSFPIYLQLIDGLTFSVLCLACSRTALSMVINEDTPASNCPAYLETFPEPGNEACQSLGFPHSDNRTYRDLADLRCGASPVMRQFSKKTPTHWRAKVVRG